MIWELFRKGYWNRLYKWIKYKYILKKDIAGFYEGIPLIRTKEFESLIVFKGIRGKEEK